MDEKKEKKLEWISHPARYRVKTTILLILFFIAISAGVYFTFESAFLAFLSMLILVVSLSSYFFPTKYKLTESGVTIKGILTERFKPWDYFHSYYCDKHGVCLSTFSYPSRLDPFRGFSLQFRRDNREEVINFIKQFLKLAEPKK